MIIYIDTLIFSNIIIDYILLLLTSFVIKKEYKVWRIILASLIGGLSSLYILFQNKNILLDIAIKLAIGLIIITVAFFPFKYNKMMLLYIVFLFLSFSLNGLILFLQNLNPNTFISRSLISYINISPVILISLTVVFYMVVRLIQKVINRKINIDKVEIIVHILTQEIALFALIDSGHTLTDPISDSQIIIVDARVLSKLNLNEKDYQVRKRIIPVSTVISGGMLEGIRCDKAEVIMKDNKIVLNKPIIASAEYSFNDDYNAIISKSAVI